MTTMIALLVTLALTPISTVPRDETVLVNEAARLTVMWDHGALSIVKVERQPLPSPERMRRWRGRFEARALAGEGKPLDFVRFDFPLMAAAEAPDDVTEDAKILGKKIRDNVKATVIVRVPLPAGARTVTIYDTVTRKAASAELPSPGTVSAPPAADGAGNTKR
jgi:hypothetical protein